MRLQAVLSLSCLVAEWAISALPRFIDHRLKVPAVAGTTALETTPANTIPQQQQALHMDQKDYEAFYANLPLQPGQTRLVRVFPAASWDDRVVCYIGVVNVTSDTLPPYNAVSYTWSGQSAEHVVSVNGRDILVTQSCVDALKGIRFQALPVVWIDQLSINQFDQEERSQQ
jgi:hypothetical protein